MKKNIFSSIAVAGLALLTLGACSDSDYTAKYQDPSTTRTASVPQVFSAVLQKGNTWMNPMYYRYYCQMTTSGIFSGVLGSNNGKGRFQGAGEPRYNDRWKNFYDMLTQHRLLEKTYENLPEIEKPNAKVMLLLSRALIDGQLHEMLSLFGSVPFNNSCTSTLWAESDYNAAKEKDKFEDDTKLYKQILDELKETADYLHTGGVSAVAQTNLKLADITVAKGSIDMWTKYVNSLRLRIALHLSTNGSLTAEAHNAIKEILENPASYPVIDSNDENMGVTASTNNDDFNFGKSLSQALHGGYTVSQTYLDALNVPANGVPSAATDPRTSYLLDPNPDGEYVSYDITKSNQEISTIASNKQKEYLARTPKIAGAGYYCTLDSTAYAGVKEYEGNNNLFGLWIGAAEVNLTKAEAYLMGYGVAKSEQKAKACFIEGVKQSNEYYVNLKTTSTLFNANTGNDSYKSQRSLTWNGVKDIDAYAEGIWEPTQKAINTQLWLNYSWTNWLEAWNTVRRTGYPEIKFAEDGIMSNYPTPPNRLPYPSDEQNYNQTNYKDAVSKYYDSKDTYGYYTKLFWAKDGKYYSIVAKQ